MIQNVMQEIHRIKSVLLSMSELRVLALTSILLTSLLMWFGVPVLQAEETDVLVTEPQWIQTKGLGGVSRQD